LELIRYIEQTDVPVMQGCTFVIPSLNYITNDLIFWEFCRWKNCCCSNLFWSVMSQKGDLLRFYIPNTLDADLSLSSNKYKISW